MGSFTLYVTYEKVMRIGENMPTYLLRELRSMFHIRPGVMNVGAFAPFMRTFYPKPVNILG